MDYQIRNDIPIYLQFSDLIKRQIFSGERQPGDRLETVREMAVKLNVNPNTVQKIFFQLEDEGLIYTDSTNGKYITSDTDKIRRLRRLYADKLTKEYEQALAEIGITSKQYREER